MYNLLKGIFEYDGIYVNKDGHLMQSGTGLPFVDNDTDQMFYIMRDKNKTGPRSNDIIFDPFKNKDQMNFLYTLAFDNYQNSEAKNLSLKYDKKKSLYRIVELDDKDNISSVVDERNVVHNETMTLWTMLNNFVFKSHDLGPDVGKKPTVALAVKVMDNIKEFFKNLKLKKEEEIIFEFGSTIMHKNAVIVNVELQDDPFNLYKASRIEI